MIKIDETWCKECGSMMTDPFDTQLGHEACLQVKSGICCRCVNKFKAYEQKISKLQIRVDALEDMISKAAPLFWTITDNADAAREWEKKAARLLRDDLQQDKK